jgi:GNAT superfamily N-acetyltransferase
MAITVREARLEDAEALYALGRSDTAFVVSDRIPFYEKQELEEWIAHPHENVLCVAECGSTLVGFFYCKIMSCHWALLDNFYIAPNTRDGVAGSVLLRALVARLKQRGIDYLTTLVEHDRVALARLMTKYGFRPSKRYDWYEMFLDQVP